jgi:hypothetical protein
MMRTWRSWTRNGQWRGATDADYQADLAGDFEPHEGPE